MIGGDFPNGPWSCCRVHIASLGMLPSDFPFVGVHNRSGIGAWYSILDFMGMASVLTNW